MLNCPTFAATIPAILTGQTGRADPITYMAGGLRKDPAIEQFAHMRANTEQHFRINRKSGPFLLITLGLLPLAVGYLSYNTHGQIQLAGLRRGENFRREWPSWLQPLMERAKPKEE